MRQMVLFTTALLIAASVANAQYVGVTDTAFAGTSGIFTFNRACHVAHPGSRMCTSEEVMDTVNPPIVGSPGEVAWVRPVFVAADYNTNPVDISGNYALQCLGWSIEGSGNNGLTLHLDTGSFDSTRSCTSATRVACCIPVPEPSASLSIPSGVGMLFALSKLRSISLTE